MKQLILTLFLLCASVGLQAQSAYEEIRNNIQKSAANHYAYPGPTQVRLTAALDGKKPFYISHYGRHGSRYCTNKDKYTAPFGILAKADSLGKLTSLGQDVMKRLALLRDEANLRWGELTPLGARQHQQIAKRMFERFPTVFEGEPYIDAKSTPVIRCILSMEYALMQLTAMNPRLHIRHDASNHDVYYMKYDDRQLKAHRVDSAIRSRYQVFLDRYDHSEQLMSKLFNDKEYVQEKVDARKLAVSLFDLASNIQNTESRKKITLYDLFSDDELYDYWKVKNIELYIKYGSYSLNGGKQPYGQRYLLRKMIEEADSCIQLEHPGASLRFGHDTNILPLVCLMELNGFGLETDNLEALERKRWIDYLAIPMGANIQLVFYRTDFQDQDVLVKVLLNENEATLPIKSQDAPYYKWKDVRDYYLKKLDAYQE